MPMVRAVPAIVVVLIHAVPLLVASRRLPTTSKLDIGWPVSSSSVL